MKKVMLSFAFASALLLAAGTASAADPAPQDVTPPSATYMDSLIRSDDQDRPRPIHRRIFAGDHYRGDGCSREEHRALMREWRRDHRDGRYDRYCDDDRYDDDRYDDDDRYHCGRRYHRHRAYCDWDDD